MLYLKGIPNSTDFYKKIFLHVIPVRLVFQKFCHINRTVILTVTPKVLSYEITYNLIVFLLPECLPLTQHPHEKINRCLTDINRCLTDILTDTF